MGAARIEVVGGRPWLASIVALAIIVALGALAGTAASYAGSVNPQNAIALVLLAAKAIDLAVALGASGRTLVDRLSGLHVGLARPSPRTAVRGGLAIDGVLAIALGAPLLLELTDLEAFGGAAWGTASTLLALLALQGATFGATRRTFGMHVLAGGGTGSA
jgi:hypothetical protein